MGFAVGFQAGVKAREAGDERRKRKKIEKGMSDIEAAKATDITESAPATPAQMASGTAETNAMAAQDAKDFGMDKPMDYRVPAQVVQKTGTQFLGQNFKGEMTAAQKDRAKMFAQAGVLSGSGDAEGGARLRREARQSEREDVRFDRETKRYATEDKKEADEEAYKKDRTDAMGNLRFSKITSGFNDGMQKYLEEKKTYDQAKAQGKVVGVEPTMPVKESYSAGDALADRARLLEVAGKYGKVDDKVLGDFTDLYRKVQDEGYAKALRIAQGGSSPEQIAAAFNESGAQIKPTDIKLRTVPGKGGGPASVVVDIAGPDGKVKSVNALAELDALGQADKVFARYYQGKSDERADRGEKRADNADRRAGAAAGRAAAGTAESKNDKNSRADAAVALYQENNPGATTAQLNAVRQGIMEAVPKSSGIESDYKPDGYGQSGTVTQKDKSGNVTITKVDAKGVAGTPLNIGAPGRQAAAPVAKPAASAPKKGQVSDGYEFLGGNPNDPKAWRKVSSGAVR